MKYLLLLLSLTAYGQASVNAPAITLNADGTTAVLAWMSGQSNGTNTMLTVATLAGSLTITVESSAGIAVNDVLAMDSEHLAVTAKAGSVLTVTRGFNGTTAAAHASGAPVTSMRYRTLNILAGAAVRNALRQIVQDSAVANAPVASATATKDANVAAAVQ